MDAFTLVAKLVLDKSEFDSGMSQVESQMNGQTASGGGLTKWGVAAGQAIGTAVTTAARAGVRAAKDALETGMNFDAAMSKVKTIAQLTDEEFGAVRQKAIDLGETTVFTAEEVSDALYYMAIAGWKSEKMIGGIEGVLSLAASTGADLARSSDIVTDAMTAMHIPVDSAGESVSHFSDVLAVAASNSNTTVEQLGEAFKYIATTGGVMGYTIEDVSYALGLLANNGIKGSMAGTSLRQVLNTLINPTADAADAMEKLGISLFEPGTDKRKPLAQVVSEFQEVFKKSNFNLEGFDREEIVKNAEALNKWYEEELDALDNAGYTKREYERLLKQLNEDFQDKWAQTVTPNEYLLRNLGDIGGLRGISTLLALMTAEAEDAEKLFNAIDNSEGAASEMSKDMLDNLRGDLTLLNSALDGLKILASDEYTRPIREFIQNLTKEIGELSKAFEEGGLAGMFNNLTQWMLDGITNTLNDDDFAKGAAGFGQALGDFVGRLVNSLLTSTPQLMEGLFNAGMGLATGLIDGLFAGLFGGDDSIGYFMDKAQKEQQDAIDQANENAIKASGIADYLDSLIKKYGDAASSTKEWAAAMEKLNSLLPGASAAMSTEAESLGAMVNNLRDYVEQLRELNIEQAKQNTLNQYREKINENLIGQAMAENERDIAASQVTAAQQAAYDLLKKDWEHNAWRFEDNPLTGQQALRPEMIDLNEPEYYTALHNAIDYLNSIGANDEDWSFEGLQEAYESAANQLESATSEIATLQSEIDTLRQQLAIAEKALADMADNAEDTADQTEDLGDIADEAGAIDTSGLQGSLDNAASALDTASGQISGMASGAHIDTGGLQSAIGNAASALNGLASAASSVSFSGLGGGGGGGGGNGPAPTVGFKTAKGAWDVPYDDYPAVLHRGEMVLTASQARKYRSGSTGDMSADALYQAVAGAVQQAVSQIQINMDGAAVGNAVTKQVSKNIYRDQYGRRFATI